MGAFALGFGSSGLPGLPGVPSFSFGEGNDIWSENSGVFTPLPSPVNVPTSAPKITTPSIPGGSIFSSVSSLITAGLGAWNTKMGTDLLQSQINHNQNPTITFDASGRPTGPISTSTTTGPNGISSTTTTQGSAAATALNGLGGGTLWILLGAVVLIMVVLKR